MSPIPDEPEAAPRKQSRLFLRYEDISQTGFMMVEAMPHALSEIWRGLDPGERAAFGSGPGVRPLLSRVAVEVGDGPISVMGPHEAEGAYQLSHTVDRDGAVDRIILGMWARVTSRVARTHDPQPADAGRPVTAGRIFAEHVFTRPLAPPAERKVRALLVDGREVVPEARHVYADPEATLALPDGATPLDAELVPDGSTTVFGLDHTDSNQHVNSLVYTRLFVEAALRRLASARRALLARSLEIAYRKPSFAGDRARVLVRAFALGDRLGAVTALVGEEAGARPRAVARIIFTG